jgi:hypothetical protein
MTNRRHAAKTRIIDAQQDLQSKKLDILPDDDNGVKELTTYQKHIYNRMLKYIKAKGLHKTQDLTRLAVSYFLDKEGF